MSGRTSDETISIWRGWVNSGRFRDWPWIAQAVEALVAERDRADKAESRAADMETIASNINVEYQLVTVQRDGLRRESAVSEFSYKRAEDRLAAVRDLADDAFSAWHEPEDGMASETGPVVLRDDLLRILDGEVTP